MEVASFESLHLLHKKVEGIVGQKAEQENSYQNFEEENEENDSESLSFPSYTKVYYGDTSNTPRSRERKLKLFSRKKKPVNDFQVDTKQAEVQEVVKQTKLQIAEYTKTSKELPRLVRFTPEVNGHAVQYEIAEIDAERKDRFHITLETYLTSLRDITKTTTSEIIAMNSKSFEKLKNILKELVDHEQKLRFLIIQLTKDITTIQVMISNTDYGTQKTTTNNKLTEQLLQNTRQLQSTSEFLEKLNIKQRFLFIQTMKEMANVYNSTIEIWKEINPKSRSLKKLHGPLPTEIESYEYSKPLTSFQMEGVVTRVKLVKSHIWVAFRCGNIRIFSRSHGAVPLFRSLKSFPAHDTAIYEVLYVPVKKGICATAAVWTSSECGELAIWNPDTGNNVNRLSLDNPLKCMRVIPNGFIWACGSNNPVISVWDAKSFSITQTFELRKGDKNLFVSSIFVANNFVVLLASKYIYIYGFDTTYICHWKVSKKTAGEEAQQGIGSLFVNENSRIFCAFNNVVTVWNVEINGSKAKTKNIGKWPIEGKVTNLFETSFCPDNGSLIWVALDNGALKLLDSETGEIVNDILEDTTFGAVQSFLQFPDSKLLVLATCDSMKPTPSSNLHSNLLWIQDCSHYVE